MNRGTQWLVCGLALWVLSAGAWADPPTEIDYQGKILVNDIPLTGEGYFKYAIADEAGTTNYWAHDGTATGEPATYVTNDCHNGVFSTVLGAAPMDAIDEMVLALDTSLYLRVWFSSDEVTFDEMLPAQPLLSAPYAVNADLLDGLHADDIIALATNGFSEVDPVFGASVASTLVPLDILNWNAAFGWGDHAAAGYLTAETDPVWTAASNLYYQTTDADARFVDVTGDTMTGVLAINHADSASLRIHSTHSAVAIGNMATGGVMGVAIGAGANATSYGAALGYQANGTQNGVAIGYTANGGTNGAAVGAGASAQNEGAALGSAADGSMAGVAVGYQADGSAQGVAVGRDSAGFSYGAAVGPWAQGQWYGAALGRAANGATNGVAIGYGAHGAMTNIAIGVAADAQMGTERIAIGHNVTNDLDHTARLRGELYMDGGMAVYGRMPFATGAFRKLLPLPPLDNVVYVATNGSPVGPGTIDRPFDTPQLGYNQAAGLYAGQPATLVIAGGTYPMLHMHAGNVHVIGQSRAEIDSLNVAAAANSIRGKQRVENLIVAGTAVVAADLGEDVKFHNCRFEGGLGIYGPNVEVQNCFATVGDGPAVIVGDGINNIGDVALTQSSFLNEAASQGALVVNEGVGNFEVVGCQIVNKLGGPCIDDLQSTPITPVHLYTHNYIRGMPPMPGSTPAVQDPMALTGTTMAFTHNTVLGHVGLNGNLQYYANNTVYGLINNVGGPGAPGWVQAGGGTGMDASGNTEHEMFYPPLPASWLD
jgi:hypothetical protein